MRKIGIEWAYSTSIDSGAAGQHDLCQVVDNLVADGYVVDIDIGLEDLGCRRQGRWYHEVQVAKCIQSMFAGADHYRHVWTVIAFIPKIRLL